MTCSGLPSKLTPGFWNHRNTKLRQDEGNLRLERVMREEVSGE